MSLPIEEQWRPVTVPGYEDLYEVSDRGRIRNAKGRVLHLQIGNHGHRYVRLVRDRVRRTTSIHRLMLSAFVRLPEFGEVARHLNGDPADNRLDNLAWGTQSDNMYDAVKHGTHVSASRTHCEAGHAFAEHAELWVRKSGDRAGRGYRLCRKCAARKVACQRCGKLLRRNKIRRHQARPVCWNAIPQTAQVEP